MKKELTEDQNDAFNFGVLIMAFLGLVLTFAITKIEADPSAGYFIYGTFLIIICLYFIVRKIRTFQGKG